MTENKQDWRIDHSAGRPILVYQNCSVIEAEQAEYVLRLIKADKLRAAGEPAAWTNEAGNVEPISDAVKQARPDLYAKGYTRPLFYAAPQASAEESAIDKPIPDSVEHYGLIDERVGAPAADAGRTDARRAQPKRRPYNASASLSEYGIFPECDAAEDSAKGAGDVQIDIDDDCKAVSGQLLELDSLLADLHRAVWHAAQDEAGIGYDIAGAQIAKAIQRKVREIVRADRQQRGGDVDERAMAGTPRYKTWLHLRTHGQWPDDIPEWAKDHNGHMNDMTAARAVIEELAVVALAAHKPDGGDALDAERLDFVAQRCTIWDGYKHIKATRENIDAAISAQQRQGEGGE